MTFDSPPAEVEEELAPIRKAVDGLRAAAANYKRPEVLAASDPAVLAVAEAHDQAMKELTPLGFNSVGSAGDRRQDGSLIVSRWFVHSDATVCGWVGLLKAKEGPIPVVFLVTEASGPAYCTTKRGGPTLTLVRPPNVSHGDHDLSVNLADTVRDHRERVSKLTAAGMRLTNVATVGDAIEVIARLNQNRSDWRASVHEQELLRADLISVLQDQARDMSAEDFSLIYGAAARWLDFQPTHTVLGEYVDLTGLAPGSVTEVLASVMTGPEAKSGTPGVLSDWLYHCAFQLRGARLQILDVFMAGNDNEGVILDASPGVYLVEARVITYGIDRRISHVRVHPKGQVGTLGERAGEVGVDLAGVAICDVERLARWAENNRKQWELWGKPLWFGRATQAGIYSCEPAKTVVPFVESGFGDGTYPIYYLMHDGRRVGLEAEFISPDTPYL